MTYNTESLEKKQTLTWTRNWCLGGQVNAQRILRQAPELKSC